MAHIEVDERARAIHVIGSLTSYDEVSALLRAGRVLLASGADPLVVDFSLTPSLAPIASGAMLALHMLAASAGALVVVREAHGQVRDFLESQGLLRWDKHPNESGRS